MKKITLVLFVTIVFYTNSHAQIVFEDDFETYAVDDELSAHAYVVTHSQNYAGTLLIDNIKVSEASSIGSYYINSSEGDDNNEGTFASPWKTLEKISSIALFPGDTVFFNKGDQFNGHFVVNGSGSKEAPIVITSYGNGNLPILTGEVGAENGGDFQEAVFVENKDNIVFENLEIHNERTNTRSGVDDVDAYGIFIYNSGTEVMENFIFRNLTFKNVYAVKPMNNPEDFNGLEVAAVRIATAKNKVEGQEKNIRDVLMENCYFTDLQRLGVHMKHAGGATGIGNDSINRNMNLVFRNNEFHYTGGTCILPTNTYNCLIEDNLFNHPGADIDPRMPGRGSSVWTWRCRHTVIQRNFCLSTRGYLDSHGIHIDHENINTFVQYNYMEDCEGGFVEILGGNLNSVYRFNISVNDGWRDNPNWINSNHTLWINENASGNQTHYCDSSYIYNNTVIIDSAYSTAIDIDAKNTFIYNNIFMAENGGNMGGKQMVIKNNGTPLFMSNNLYYGNVVNTFKSKDANALEGNPDFNGDNNEYWEKYELNQGSPGVNTGIPMNGPVFPLAGKGIFKDIPAYAEVDFYGNPIDMSEGTPNIGASNVYSPISSIRNLSEQKQEIFSLNSNIIDSAISIQMLSDLKLAEVFITGLNGKVVYKNSLKIINKGNIVLDISALRNGLYFITVCSDSSKQSKRFIKRTR
ncbi:MAG: T9SS type A sorting domain-containing protein [Bacteroidetes bacterium]|nr:T9SS type A sorting domain-containing protein [Bacteroidota bacterium]